MQEKWLGIAALFICIELVFFKFLPDLSTAVVQNSKSTLADFATFHEYYLTPGSVFYPRFLGTWVLITVAKSLGHLFHSDDVRLNPLRVAAGLLTPIYAYLGAILAIQDPAHYSWRHFLVLYSLAAIMGLYIFYPGDMPSFALLSITLYCILCERLALALLFMLLTGLFRESSLHAVFFVFVWTLSSGSRSPAAKLAWLAAFSVSFASEYLAVRHFFPGPVSSVGGFITNPHELLQEMYSLTTICSLGLAVLFAAACLLSLKQVSPRDWRCQFFRLNCFAFPFWILFYRMLNGNIAEFRLLWPVILPCIYGVAYCVKTPAQSAPDELIVRTAQKRSPSSTGSTGSTLHHQ